MSSHLERLASNELGDDCRPRTIVSGALPDKLGIKNVPREHSRFWRASAAARSPGGQVASIHARAAFWKFWLEQTQGRSALFIASSSAPRNTMRKKQNTHYDEQPAADAGADAKLETVAEVLLDSDATSTTVAESTPSVESAQETIQEKIDEVEVAA